MKTIKSGVYKTVDLEKILGNKMAIAKAVSDRDLYKCGHGFYRTPDLEDQIQVSAMIVEKYFNDAVVSRQTALVYYELFNDPGSFFNADVSSDSSVMKHKDILALHRSKRIHSGVVKVVFKGAKVLMYTPARAVFEVLAINGDEEDINQVLGKFVKKYGPEGVSEMEKYTKSFGKEGEDLYSLAKRLVSLTSVF